MVAQGYTQTTPPAPLGLPIVRACGVTKRFGLPPHDLVVLHPLDLEIRTGQLTLIMGPSGSGKTTLLTILGLLLRPTTGTIAINGHDVTGYTESELPAIRRRDVSFIFQGFNLLSALTAAENVQVGLELQGIHGRKALARALELLARVGLEDRAAHLPGEMSGGERQRVGVARALASRARLLLADEPTGNLDGETSKRVVDLLRHLACEEDRAVVIVTHDPRLEPLADRIVRMEDGRIVADEKEVAS
jgi:putative ABC transport system ATP-binding protein